MVKNLVFDLDNTLLYWKDEYINALYKTLKDLNYNLSFDKINDIDNCIDSYENYYEYLTKESLVNFINDRCNMNFDINFIDLLLKNHEDCYNIDEKLIDTLDYLSSKYDLYVITNYFTETQIARLKNAKILKYFKKVYGGDTNYLKPNLKAFDNIKDKENSIMIGDNINFDIIPSMKVGMKAILISQEKNLKYKTIKNIYELKEML
ncbi:MAG: HAD family hydrolase [bacterium]|nr:HAD family hydrolase [bacterium]